MFLLKDLTPPFSVSMPAVESAFDRRIYAIDESVQVIDGSV